MTLIQIIILISCWLLSGACTTHYYYPAYELGLQHSPSPSSRTKSLSDAKFKLRCRLLSETGKALKDPGLCRRMGDWLALHQAVLLEQDAASSGEEQVPDLTVELDSSTLVKPPEALEKFMNIGTFGFYPTLTDRWYRVEIRIFDTQNNLIEKGDFNALFRTYFGWGYFLMARIHGLIKKPITYQASVDNSKDFYRYVGELLRSAYIEQQNPVNAGVEP